MPLYSEQCIAWVVDQGMVNLHTHTVLICLKKADFCSGKIKFGVIHSLYIKKKLNICNMTQRRIVSVSFDLKKKHFNAVLKNRDYAALYLKVFWDILCDLSNLY